MTLEKLADKNVTDLSRRFGPERLTQEYCNEALYIRMRTGAMRFSSKLAIQLKFFSNAFYKSEVTFSCQLTRVNESNLLFEVCQ